MPKKTHKEEALDILADEFLSGEQEPDALIEIAAECARRYDDGWRPQHGPTQRIAFEDKTSKYILLDAERASGKTVVALDMLVDHCFNNKNAMAALVVRESSMAKDGGAWDKLIHRNLDIWKNGNIKERTGERTDTGIGLKCSPVTRDPETKKPFFWLLNRYGTWGKVVCISLPVGAHIKDRIRGPEYSFILVEEAQATDTDDYFVEVIQQVGRRQGIDWQQQVIYTCNPKGPSHWLYKKFFVDPYNEETQDWHPDYARYHIPISENIDNLPPGYYDNLIEACRNNAILHARNIGGEWIDIPEGAAIFRDVFFPNIHVRGDYHKGQGFVATTGIPIISGWDLGVGHSSLHFMQAHTLIDRVLWMIIDELNFVNQYVPYPRLVPKILERMDYWDKRGGPYAWIHISDDSAFNQLRPDGSYDVQTVERLSEGRIKLKAAPKGPESRPARIHMLMDMFVTEQILISAMCPKTVRALSLCEAEKKKDYDANYGFIPKKGPYVHVIDSLTYPPFYYQATGSLGFAKTEKVAKSTVIHCGGR